MVEQGHADRGAVSQEDERIAVLSAFERRTRRRYAAGARIVLDDKALAELAAERLGDEPRGDVGDAARAEG